MARIAGVDLPREKRVEIGLTYIYGIGRVTSNKILEANNIDPNIRVKDLTEDQVAGIRDYIENNIPVEGDLKRQVFLDIKRIYLIIQKLEFTIILMLMDQQLLIILLLELILLIMMIEYI